jgi:hypothetical protein
MHYVSIFARLIRNSKHVKVLRLVQPKRQSCDVFPTAYKMNSLRKVQKLFPDWANYSYIHTSDPQYFFGSRSIYRLCQFLHALLPSSVAGNVFIFLRSEPDAVADQPTAHQELMSQSTRG